MGFREGDIAGLPAVRTVVQTVRAEMNVVLPLANRAVLFASAIAFRFVTLDANDRTLHGSLLRKLYLTGTEDDKAGFYACNVSFTCRIREGNQTARASFDGF